MNFTLNSVTSSLVVDHLNVHLIRFILDWWWVRIKILLYLEEDVLPFEGHRNQPESISNQKSAVIFWWLVCLSWQSVSYVKSKNLNKKFEQIPIKSFTRDLLPVCMSAGRMFLHLHVTQRLRSSNLKARHKKKLTVLHNKIIFMVKFYRYLIKITCKLSTSLSKHIFN